MSLNLFAFFHLNLMFSSIAEERRPEVIARAYWPLLDLPRRIGAPIGLEASGLTLEIIRDLDPAWIETLRARIKEGRIEFIGSGYAQIIGPLAPAEINARNLRYGMETYKALLGLTPKLALVNEQAFSGGLIPIYKAHGVETLLMDWDNLAPFHADWPPEARFRPCRAQSPNGETINLLWTQTLAFQRLQRCAHGDISIDDYLATIEAFNAQNKRTLCLYSNDAEIFDIRPGRLHTEDKLDGAGEWDRIAQAWTALRTRNGMNFVAPSQALATLNPDARPLILETAANPIPVKKQPKYNIARWAVAGRDNLAVNAACERLTARARAQNATSDESWRTLCRLWSSDFRTHIADQRWQSFRDELAQLDKLLDCPHPILPTPQPNATPASAERWIDCATPALQLRLNRRRGLAVDGIARTGDARPPMLTSLLHGRYHAIDLQADWYTGNVVFEALDGPKVTDLDWAEARAWTRPDTAAQIVETTIPTRKGNIFKRLTLHADAPRLDIDLVFDWPDWGRGALRAGHFLLNPDAFHWPDLTLETANGGFVRDRYKIGAADYDHSAAVSLQVSSSAGLGATDGTVTIGDGRRKFSIHIDRTVAPLLVMVQNRMTADGPFCRIMLSALETDDTRKPAQSPSPPRHIRYGLVLEE